jgi:hypothetical protein
MEVHVKRLMIAFSLGCLVSAVALLPSTGQAANTIAPQAAPAAQKPLLTHAADPGLIRPGRWTNKIWIPSPGGTPTVMPEAQWPASTKSEIAKFRAGQPKWPPMFPNDYATKIFENEKITVYDSTLGDVDRLHKHMRDLIAIYVQDDGSRRDIAIRDGQPVVTTTKEDQTTLNGERGVSSARYNGAPLPHVSGYVRAGILHSEAAVTPAQTGTRRVFFVEFKGTEPADCKDWSTAC